MLPYLICYRLITRLITAFHRRLMWLLRSPNRDAGYTTEVVVVTALLVVLAIAAVALIAAKVRGKAAGLDLG